jgi:hypothetical protein
MLAAEIREKLCKDTRVVRVTTQNMVSCKTTSCLFLGSYACCRVLIIEDRLSFVSLPHCSGCIAVYSRAIPPVDNYLQRRHLLCRLQPPKSDRGCLCCYRWERRVEEADGSCRECELVHRQETDDLVGKWAALKEVFGADVGREVMGHLLYFFCGKYERDDPSCMLSQLIQRKLDADKGVYKKADWYISAATCRGGSCRIAMHSPDWLIFDFDKHCRACINAFSGSLPAADSYLQRCELILHLPSRIVVGGGCLLCYRRTGVVRRFNAACTECIVAHRSETLGLCEKWMALKEVLGADIGRVVMKYCFDC